MTYVKRRGMILLVDDSQVQKYTREGFEVYTPPTTSEKKPKKGVAKEPPAIPEAGAKDGSTGK